MQSSGSLYPDLEEEYNSDDDDAILHLIHQHASFNAYVDLADAITSELKSKSNDISNHGYCFKSDNGANSWHTREVYSVIEVRS